MFAQPELAEAAALAHAVVHRLLPLLLLLLLLVLLLLLELLDQGERVVSWRRRTLDLRCWIDRSRPVRCSLASINLKSLQGMLRAIFCQQVTIHFDDSLCCAEHGAEHGVVFGYQAIGASLLLLQRRTREERGRSRTRR